MSIVKNKGKMTLDKLATIMAGSFEGFEKRITENMDQRFDGIDMEIKGIKNQLEGVNKRVDDVYVNMVKYEDHNALKKRVSVSEKV